MCPQSASLTFLLRTFRAPCLALASIVLIGGSAFADDRYECIKAAGEEAIGACSRLISAGNLADFAAPAFYNRGTAYTQKSDLDAAMKDFNEALRDARIYYNRAAVYRRKDQNEQAIADYQKALELSADLDVIKTKLLELGVKTL